MEKCVINVLGTNYRIIPKELKNADIVNNVGDFDFLQKKQLRHEIIHAFLSESGLQCNWQHMEQFGHDETTVDWFAIQSPKIFEVFKELELI